MFLSNTEIFNGYPFYAFLFLIKPPIAININEKAAITGNNGLLAVNTPKARATPPRKNRKTPRHRIKSPNLYTSRHFPAFSLLAWFFLTVTLIPPESGRGFSPGKRLSPSRRRTRPPVVLRGRKPACFGWARQCRFAFPGCIKPSGHM